MTDGAADLSISFPEVDFEGLRSINEQVVGWIYDESSVINYPIAQARDNDYYLHRMFNGESNPADASSWTAGTRAIFRIPTALSTGTI